MLIVKAYDILKNVKINKSECARMCDITRHCLYKYIKLIIDETMNIILND